MSERWRLLGKRKRRRERYAVRDDVEVPPRFELGRGAFAELCLTTWLWHLMKYGAKDSLLRIDVWSE